MENDTTLPPPPSPPPPRPPSIVAFERLYLGSTLVYLVASLFFWSATRELMLSSPQMQSTPAMQDMIGGIMIASLVVTVLVSLLFWWLVARGRSVVGKWLVVASEAVGVLTALLGLLRLVRGTAPVVPQVVLSLIVTALAVAAAAMLFRSDATAWFGADDRVEEIEP